MPVMSGFEATALIRKYEEEHRLKPIPIITLTSHAMIGYRVYSLPLQMIVLTDAAKMLTGRYDQLSDQAHQ
jgi:CheY-like chemotaxis protein